MIIEHPSPITDRRYKLFRRQVLRIRLLYAARIRTQCELAGESGVTQANVSLIVNRHTRRDA